MAPVPLWLWLQYIWTTINAVPYQPTIKFRPTLPRIPWERRSHPSSRQCFISKKQRIFTSWNSFSAMGGILRKNTACDISTFTFWVLFSLSVYNSKREGKGLKTWCGRNGVHKHTKCWQWWWWWSMKSNHDVSMPILVLDYWINFSSVKYIMTWAWGRGSQQHQSKRTRSDHCLAIRKEGQLWTSVDMGHNSLC